jgi:hypothetical protein
LDFLGDILVDKRDTMASMGVISASFSEEAVPGMALASLELHRTMITLMVLHKVVPLDLTMELIDQALQRIEKLQMSGNASIEGPARAARLHIEVLLKQLHDLPSVVAQTPPPSPN